MVAVFAQTPNKTYCQCTIVCTPPLLLEPGRRAREEMSDVQPSLDEVENKVLFAFYGPLQSDPKSRLFGERLQSMVS